jgi:hypothetical protein
MPINKTPIILEIIIIQYILNIISLIYIALI